MSAPTTGKQINYLLLVLCLVTHTRISQWWHEQLTLVCLASVGCGRVFE